MTKWYSKLAQMSAYGRAEEHLLKQTASGAMITVFGVALTTILFLSETREYMTMGSKQEMYVDTKIIDEVALHFNITFPATPCTLLSLDILDISGSTEIDVSHDVYKQRLDRAGRPKGLEAPFRFDLDKYREKKNLTVATQQERDRLIRELAEGEGCGIAGDMSVRRVGSTVHFGVNAFSSFLLGQVIPDPRAINMSHTIRHLQFGPDFPGRVNPLDGASRSLAKGEDSGMYKYFIQVVPTEYRPGWGRALGTNQYSVTEYFMPSLADNYNDLSQVPGVYLYYDFFPIRVTVTDRKKSFPHFLVRICAVVGGAFAVTGLLDKLVYGVISFFIEEPAAGQARPSIVAGLPQHLRSGGGSGPLGSPGSGGLGGYAGAATGGPAPAQWGQGGSGGYVPSPRTTGGVERPEWAAGGQPSPAYGGYGQGFGR